MSLLKIYLMFLAIINQCWKVQLFNRLDAVTYLINYGFLQSKHHPNDPQVTFALRKFQEYNKLRQTGVLDRKTLEIMNSPRCGMKDVDKYQQNKSSSYTQGNLFTNTKHTQTNHFKLTNTDNIFWYYVSNATIPSYLDEDLVYKALEYAFNRWSSITNVRFKNGAMHGKPDIYIGFYAGNHSDPSPFDGVGGKVAHAANLDLSYRKIGFIHFDLAEHWLINQTSEYYFEVPKHDNKPGSGVDFVYTAIHEVGHVLGLNHVPNRIKSVMNTVLPTPVLGDYRLFDYDVLQIQASYGKCQPKKFDSIFSINDQTYIIVGPFVYLFDSIKHTVDRKRPWPRLTKEIFGMDLIREGFSFEGFLYLFQKTKYNVLQTQNNIPTKRILQYNTPAWYSMITFSIDAAFTHIDGYNYLFQQSFVYRWNSTGPPYDRLPNGKVADGWPKKISAVFPGLPNSIDTAFRWPLDGRTYFFKGPHFYIWDPVSNKADGLYSIAQWRNVCDVFVCRKHSNPFCINSDT